MIRKKKKNADQQSSQLTQGVNATLQLCERDVHVAFSQLQQDGHRQLEICRYPNAHLAVQKRRYERLINCKINAHKTSV